MVTVLLITVTVAVSRRPAAGDAESSPSTSRPSVGRCTAEFMTGTVTAALIRARAAAAAATAPR